MVFVLQVVQFVPKPKTVEELQGEVDDVTKEMHTNIIKIRDRHGKLEDMEIKAERIEEDVMPYLVNIFRVHVSLFSKEMSRLDWKCMPLNLHTPPPPK